MPRGFLSFALGCALVFGGAGCGGGASGVKGKVLYNGAPVHGAEVTFENKDKGSEGRYVARTDAEGNFEIPPVAGKSMKPGRYKVLIVQWVDKNNKVPSEEDYGQLQAQGALRNRLPAKYNDDAFSDLQAEIKDGTHVLPPFELKGAKK